MTNPDTRPTVPPVEGHYALLRNGSFVHPECITEDFDLDGTPYYLPANIDEDYYWTPQGVCQRPTYPKGIPKLIFVPDHDIIATISPADMHAAANGELERLRAALDDIFEMWAGSEGFIPHTAPEGYLLMLVKKMADRAALAKMEESK